MRVQLKVAPWAGGVSLMKRMGRRELQSSTTTTAGCAARMSCAASDIVSGRVVSLVNNNGVSQLVDIMTTVRMHNSPSKLVMGVNLFHSDISLINVGAKQPLTTRC
jgi:hypothetical protein